MSTSSPPTTVNLSIPSKYLKPNSTPSSSSPPSLEWLSRTWTVAHSTLSMWRTARNVRISYKPLDPKPDGRARLDDLVEYESNTNDTSGVKSVTGIDTASSAGDVLAWDWRGKSWLFFVTSHWEILGWGERPLADGGVERWAVTWFAPTVFTKEGIDVYCDRREGLSEETFGLVMEALRSLDAKAVVDMAREDMRPVEIKLPWKT